MSPLWGWALAAAAVVSGYFAYGGRGVALALSAVVFWLLLQFSRALRVMRLAAQNPVGRSANAVMLATRVHPGLRLMQVVALTHSLGQPADAPVGAEEAFRWHDEGGDAVLVALRGGRVCSVALQRAAAGDEADDAQAGEHQAEGARLGHG